MQQFFRSHIDSVLFGAFLACILLGAGALSRWNVNDAHADALDTSFTYQGFLEQDGAAYDGTCDFRFRLWDQPTGGLSLTLDEIKNNVPVDRGVFSVKLDFGYNFRTEKRWISVHVRCPAGSGEYTDLSPRTEVTAAPLAQSLPHIFAGVNGGIGINTSFPTEWLDVAGAIRTRNHFYVTDGAGASLVRLGHNADDAGYVVTTAPDGLWNTYVGASLQDQGAAILYDDSGSSRAQLSVSSSGYGYGETEGPNGNDNVRLTALGSNLNHGFVGVYNAVGSSQASMTILGSGEGYIETEGPNGNNNILLSSHTSSANHGYIGVQDAGGVPQAAIFVNNLGNGVVSADVKNFRVANPNQPGTEIWYASLEGPEAAAYARGTAQLVNGQATVLLPDHFQAVASDKGITVQLTPLSADSSGLAVVEKSRDEILVQELHGGTGSYEFDFFVTAVRAGHEDYQVVRPVSETEAAVELGIEASGLTEEAEPVNGEE